MRIPQRAVVVLALFIAGLLTAGPSGAVTINFTSGPANVGGFGNSLTFSNGGISVTASAFAETGTQTPANSGWYLFQTAEVYRWSTGLGVCNRNEGYVAQNSCGDDEHEIDTVGRDDLLLFVFSQNVVMQSITVDPYDSSGSDPNDRDITYWVGNLANLAALTTRTFNTLGTMPGFSETYLAASSGFDPLTHLLSGTGNVLLVSGDYRDRNCKNADVTTNSECEAFKIKNLVVSAAPAVVPVPAAAWLFLSAFGVLTIARRKS